MNVICPICGSYMVLRNGKYGLFYGCSRYPMCKFTLDQKDGEKGAKRIEVLERELEALEIEEEALGKEGEASLEEGEKSEGEWVAMEIPEDGSGLIEMPEEGWGAIDAIERRKEALKEEIEALEREREAWLAVWGK